MSGEDERENERETESEREAEEREENGASDIADDADVNEDGEREDGERGDDEKLEFRGLGEKAEKAESKLENFWYYHKWKVIFGAVIAAVLAVTAYQMITRDSPDIYVMYAGPGYTNAAQVDSIRTAFRSVIDDYNGDGKVGTSLMMLTCLTEEQIEERHDQAIAESRQFVINRNSNLQNIKQFDNEIGYGDSIIYMIDPSLYERVREAGGFMRLEDIFTEEELEGIETYDGCGVYLSSLKFTEVNSVFQSFPSDTILCIRKITAMSSAFKNKDDFQKRHDDHIEAFRNIVLFEYPEGWETGSGEDSASDTSASVQAETSQASN